MPAGGASSSAAAEDEDMEPAPVFVSREIKLVPNAASVSSKVEQVADVAIEDAIANSTSAPSAAGCAEECLPRAEDLAGSLGDGVASETVRREMIAIGRKPIDNMFLRHGFAAPNDEEMQETMAWTRSSDEEEPMKEDESMAQVVKKDVQKARPRSLSRKRQKTNVVSETIAYVCHADAVAGAAVSDPVMKEMLSSPRSFVQ